MKDPADPAAHRVEELLADWELSRLEGTELTPEELAGSCPELLDELRAGVAALKSTAWVLDDPEELVRATAEDAAETQIPESSQTVEELIEAIVESGLLTPSACDDLRVEARSQKATWTSREMASLLVERGALTTYQARVLLTRGQGPLLLDRYTVLDAIGAGGMGLVFKAMHRSMERVVALKILPPGAIDSRAKAERFRREIKAVAKLSHPNVVAAYDAHEADGTHFLAMEYVDGKNLLDLVREEGPLTVRQSTLIITDVARALAEAHRQGVIHRDVKPSNVLLTSDGVPKLSDLGIAKVRDSTNGATSLTSDGFPVGTIAYMSPEQIQGDVDADERSDVYGLGCTYYYLLTGKPLFEKKSGFQVVAAHLTEPAPTLAAGGAVVPSAIERVYGRMVAKEPTDRYGSMDEVVAAVEASSASDSPLASSKRVGDQAGVSPPRVGGLPWRTAAAALAFAALLVAGGAFIRNIGARPSDRGPNLVDEERERIATRTVDVAQSVLLHNGRLVLQQPDGLRECERLHLLPDPPYEISAIELGPGGAGVDLSSFRGLSQLSYVSLSDIRVGRKGLSSIASLSSVVDLGLIACRLTDRDLEPIAEMRWLQSLSLAGNDITDDGLRRLADLRRLRVLHLGQTLVTGEGLEALLDLPELVEVDLTDCAIDGAGIRRLRRLSNLRSLTIGGIDASDDVVAALRELPPLAELSLDRVRMTTALALAVASMESLESLRISRSSMGDDHLQRLADLPNLRVLNAEATEVTEGGVARLKRQRPAIEVVWSRAGD